jgi:hypothetical protein
MVPWKLLPSWTGMSLFPLKRRGADDSLLALANASRQYHLVKPIMTDRPVLEINEGRHLIQEQLVHTYVTNDSLLQGDHQEDESGLNSMVSTNLSRDLRWNELISDDRDWCEWIWEVGIWEASCSHRFHGSDREFRTCHQRYYRNRR